MTAVAALFLGWWAFGATGFWLIERSCRQSTYRIYEEAMEGWGVALEGWRDANDRAQEHLDDLVAFADEAAERLRMIAALPTDATIEGTSLEAECERHRRANLVRTVINGWDEGLDGSLTDYINESGWDAVPWRIAQTHLDRAGQSSSEAS